MSRRLSVSAGSIASGVLNTATESRMTSGPNPKQSEQPVGVPSASLVMLWVTPSDHSKTSTATLSL